MKLGIHCGLNQVSPDFYNGWPGYLSGCFRDADTMAATFGTLGYDTKALFDADCTLERVRKELLDAATALASGDTLVFSDSGHGGQSLGMLSGTTETLCFFDGQLADAELRAMLSQFKAGVNVVVILDSCHSGGMDREIGKRARVAPLWVTRDLPVTPAKGDAPIAANVLLLAACQRDETAGDGDLNGAFTGSLLASLGDGMTWRQWFDATTRYMSRNFPDQHPAIVSLNGTVADAAI